MLEKRLVILGFLFLLFLNFSSAESFSVILNETFDPIVSQSFSSSSLALNRTYAPTWVEYSDGIYLISKPGFNGSIQGSSIFNGTLYRTGESFPVGRFKIEMCPQGFRCYFNNESRISYNYQSTAHSCTYLCGSMASSWGLGLGNVNDTSFNPSKITINDDIGEVSAPCNYDAVTSGTGFRNFTYQTIFNVAYNAGECGSQDNLDDWDEFNYIYLRWYQKDTTNHASYTSRIDNITITNVLMVNGTNQLPEINSFNLTSYDCINTSSVSQNGVDVYYNLDVYDPDGDTIYYSISPTYSELYTQFIYSAETPVTNCQEVDFLGIPTGIVYCGNMETCSMLTGPYLDFLCPLSNMLDVDVLGVKHGVTVIVDSQPSYSYPNGQCFIYTDGSNYTEFYTHKEPDKAGVYRDMLVHSPQCSKDPASYYDFGDGLGDLSTYTYSTDYYWYSHVGQIWNVTFRSSLDPYNSYVNGLLFYQNETGTILVHWTNYSNILNVPLGGFTIGTLGTNDYAYMGMYYKFNASNGMFYLNLTNKVGTQYTFSRNVSNGNPIPVTRFVEHRINANDDAGYLMQSGFVYGGLALNTGSWSTSAPTQIDGVNSAMDNVCIYVTDDSHMNNSEYNYACSQFNPEICQNPNDNNLVNNPITDPLKSIFSPLLHSLGMEDFVYNLNFIVWILLFLLLFFMLHSWGIAWFASTLFMLILSIIGFGSITHIISYVVLLALGITPYIVQMLMPVQRGNG